MRVLSRKKCARFEEQNTLPVGVFVSRGLGRASPRAWSRPPVSRRHHHNATGKNQATKLSLAI